MPHLRARRFIAWIALAALLLGALAPTVSHALARAASGAPALQDLCTVGAPGRVAEPAAAALAAAASEEPESALALNHCPFCLPIADRLGPPPAASLHFFTAESGLARPDAQAFFFRSATRLLALPRGPPPRS